jgi:hypothetical protein
MKRKGVKVVFCFRVTYYLIIICLERMTKIPEELRIPSSGLKTDPGTLWI